MLRPRRPPPADRAELMARAYSLAGRTLGQLATEEGAWIPEELRRAKGWIGELIEHALGAPSTTAAERDFPSLGVELKTLPVTLAGVPRQSTYVCLAPMDGGAPAVWEQSWVAQKLRCVLWIPIVGDGPPATRMIGGPLLWEPSPEEDALLKADWELLSELLALGHFEQISAHHGAALQLRPKAANAREHVWVISEEGEWARTTPLGFYLRSSFTAELLARRMVLPRRG